MTRDGSIALRETLNKKNVLAEAFGEKLLPEIPHNMHKLETLRQILSTHEPRKAIVFVDRIVIADSISRLFPEMHPVVFKGKSGKFDQHATLQMAKDVETRLVISTSAGEEGIDLPSADLLIIWGNAASDLRFIQRLGRIMRKAGEGLKFATFVVTPETTDFDSFALGLAKAAEIGTVDVEKIFGWDADILLPKTTWWHITELLRGKPRRLTEMSEALGVRDELAERMVDNAVRQGRLFYVYDVEGICNDMAIKGQEWMRDYAEKMIGSLAPNWKPNEYMQWSSERFATSMMGRSREYRIYALADDPDSLKRENSNLFAQNDIYMALESRIGQGRNISYKSGRSVTATMELPPETLSLLYSETEVRGISLSRKKSEKLEYLFRPQSLEVLKVMIENAARLFELLNRRCI